MTTRWRYFLVYEDRKQEVWLEEQARRGLHLTRPGLFRFEFAEGERREEKYRLDFRTLRGAAREEYIALFRDAGWDFLGQVANRYYFRARPDAESPEIFTDVESRRDYIRRQLRFGALLTAALGFQLISGVIQLIQRLSAHTALGASVLTITLAGAFFLFGVWCLWQMERAYRREERTVR
jgi:uncharacterized protein DUF2812